MSSTPQTHQEWIRLIRQRDGNRCTQCGSTQDLAAHHLQSQLDHPELALDLENGITLCHRCHRKAHKDHQVKVRTLGAHPAIKIYSNGTAHIPKGYIDAGYVGGCRAQDAVFTLLVLKPDTTIENAIKSLELHALRLKQFLGKESVHHE